MFIEYIPPIATTEEIGKFKVDGTTLEVDENGMLKIYSIPYEAILDDNTWEQISAASTAGVAADLWSVGDCKKITLNGTVGTLSLSNYDTYIYILGFNHNSSLEGTGISFGGFKTALSGGKDVCLIDSQYGKYNSNGTKYFNMQHWGANNYGGWKGCDLRYDVLGSTDSAPSGYGSDAQSGRTGTDASSTTATSPVSNTLMAALPSDLRAVMKPITKYSDNVAGGTENQAKITASIDYLPLLAEFEVHGAISYANTYEASYQKQYTYYANGNSKIKYRHSSISSTAMWQCRSPFFGGYEDFCFVDNSGSTYLDLSNRGFGLAPVFLV